MNKEYITGYIKGLFYHTLNLTALYVSTVILGLLRIANYYDGGDENG
jgi:hypothetical protein